jgi:hypothetical protein
MAKKAWRLIFVEGLLQAYLAGDEVWTFRKYSPGSHEFVKGQLIEGHFKDGLMLLLEVMEDTTIKPFRDITDDECQTWGDCPYEDMMERMAEYYPGVTDDDTAALIRTRLARVGDRQIAGFLPEGL